MILNRTFFFLYLHEKRPRQAGARKASERNRRPQKRGIFYLGILCWKLCFRDPDKLPNKYYAGIYALCKIAG
jgi:hypothetical protein